MHKYWLSAKPVNTLHYWHGYLKKQFNTWKFQREQREVWRVVKANKMRTVNGVAPFIIVIEFR